MLCIHRCLEGLFDTWGTFGVGFNGDLEMGGPVPIGAQRANLSDTVRMYMEEVALNEQVLLTSLPSLASLIALPGHLADKPAAGAGKCF